MCLLLVSLLLFGRVPRSEGGKGVFAGGVYACLHENWTRVLVVAVGKVGEKARGDVGWPGYGK